MMRRGLWLALAICTQAAAHGHPAPIDPSHPDAWKHRLCAEMTSVAVAAVQARDKGAPMKHFAADGGPGPRLANAIVAKVYSEPAISSPKRAEAYARSYCNQSLQEESAQ